MTAKQADPITVEVVRNAVVAYADEMAEALCKSAYNMMIYEVRDYCCGLLDIEARMISQNRGGLPIFLADLGVAVGDGIRRHGLGGFAEGDVLVMNHGHVCGQHRNNVVVYAPCFHQGELIGFAANRAHWVDIGGGRQGFGSNATTDIYSEGLQMRSLKIYRAGELNETLREIIRDNIRYPEASLGDLRAQVASCQLGARRYAELVARYGRATVEECVRTIWDQTDQAVRRVVQGIPDGVYTAESFLDDDGRTFGRPLRIKVRVAVAGSTMRVDFAAMHPQVNSPLNSGRSGGIAAARRNMGGCSFFGFHDDGSRFQLMHIFGGGWGGRPHEDGESAAVSVCQGDVRNTPVELQEIKCPFIIEQHALRRDSGGAGEHRGGLGIALTYRCLRDCRGNINFDRTVTPPWGLHGGRPGAVSVAMIERADGTRQTVQKATDVQFRAGDRVTLFTAGGGGYGDPKKRARQMIERDITMGFVSAEAARTDYGHAGSPEKIAANS